MQYSPSWALILIIIFQSSKLTSSVNQAPAKVSLRIQVSRLDEAFAKKSKLTLCIAKINERCFWSTNHEITWNGEQYKEIPFGFAMDNMAVDLTFEVTIESTNQKIEFITKTINLKSLKSKESFEMNSLNLDNLVTVIIEHECEVGYFPPRLCTQKCYPMPNQWECDDFGNKICKEGLIYDQRLDRCIINNCTVFNIKCGNGHCVNKASAFECVCNENYYGKFCQFRNPCSTHPCYNGGTCTYDQNMPSFKCLCSSRFTGPRCLTKVKEKCSCPEDMRCKFSESGEFELCFPEIVSNSRDIAPIHSSNKDKLQMEWGKVSLYTTIIAAVGCFMFLMCVGVSLYVFCQTRENQNTKRNCNTGNSPSTLYTDFTPKSTETSFKRSFSLDDNSAYIAANSQIFQMMPNNFQMGFGNEYSLNGNSYQDFPPTNLIKVPVFDGFNGQREYPATPLVLYKDQIHGRSGSPTSSNSLKTPPHLPPRSNSNEMTSSGTPSIKNIQPCLLSN